MAAKNDKELCACGEPLHYAGKEDEAERDRRVVDDLIKIAGPYATCSDASGRTWLVPRHYLALHRVHKSTLADVAKELGFEEVT